MITKDPVPRTNWHMIGARAYIQYLVGVETLRNPTNPMTTGSHGWPVEEANLEHIIGHAESRMLEGAQRFIQAAGSDRALHALEHSFHDLEPMMNGIIDYACAQKHRKKQINELNPAFRMLQPSPFVVDKVTFGFVCHSRREKLATLGFMGGIQPADLVAPLLDGRFMVKAARRGSAALSA